MGFDCWTDLVNKNIKLRLYELESDPLVVNQILREIRLSESDASLRLSSELYSLDFLIY